MMKMYGYFGGSDEEAPALLEEVTIAASPAVVRRIAAFLLHAAEQMEKHGAAYGHEHFQDFDKAVSTRPRLIVSAATLAQMGVK